MKKLINNLFGKKDNDFLEKEDFWGVVVLKAQRAVKDKLFFFAKCRKIKEIRFFY